MEQERPTSYRNFSLLYGAGKYEGFVIVYEINGGTQALLRAMFLGLDEAKRAVDWRWSVIDANKWLPVPEDLKAFHVMKPDSPMDIAKLNLQKLNLPLQENERDENE